MARAQHLVELGRDEHARHALLGQRRARAAGSRPWRRRRCRGSARRGSAACGFVASQRARITFCWLPPLRFLTGWSADGRRDVEQLDVLVGDLVLLGRAQVAEPAAAGLDGQDDVLAHGQVGDDPLGLAVLRAERDAALDRAERREVVDRLAVDRRACRRSGWSMPKSRLAISVRPEPSRPARPTTSPAWSSRSNGSIEPGRPSPSASSSGSPAPMRWLALHLVPADVVELGQAPPEHLA